MTVPVLGFVASSGSGKTTLLAKVLPLLREAGLRVGVIKHAHHRFEVDVPGKDSHTLRKAGAAQMLVASSRLMAWMEETPDRDGEPTLDELLARLDQSRLDLVLVEGFKEAPIAKVEVFRPAHGQPPLYPWLGGIVAVATDAPLDDSALTTLDLNDVGQVVDFVVGFCRSR